MHFCEVVVSQGNKIKIKWFAAFTIFSIKIAVKIYAGKPIFSV
jgi:hypothetical protein